MYRNEPDGDGEECGGNGDSDGNPGKNASTNVEVCGNLPRQSLWPVKNKKLETLMNEINSYGEKSNVENYLLEVERKKQEKKSGFEHTMDGLVKGIPLYIFLVIIWIVYRWVTHVWMP